MSNPNSVAYGWIKEWRNEAKERGSKLQYSYNKILRSLEKYPLPLSSGTEFMILDGVGTSIASKVDLKLKEYYKSGGNLNQLHSAGKTINRARSLTSVKVSSKKPDLDSAARYRTPSDYVPKPKTSAYALLTALWRCFPVHVDKATLIERSQSVSDLSLDTPKKRSEVKYSVWHSMTNLIQRGLVTKTDKPHKFHLSEAGCKLCRKLHGKQSGSKANGRPANVNRSIPVSSDKIWSDASDPDEVSDIPVEVVAGDPDGNNLSSSSSSCQFVSETPRDTIVDDASCCANQDAQEPSSVSSPKTPVLRRSASVIDEAGHPTIVGNTGVGSGSLSSRTRSVTPEVTETASQLSRRKKLVSPCKGVAQNVTSVSSNGSSNEISQWNLLSVPGVDCTGENSTDNATVLQCTSSVRGDSVDIPSSSCLPSSAGFGEDGHSRFPIGNNIPCLSKSAFYGDSGLHQKQSTMEDILYTFQPGSFDVILIVDNQETLMSKSGKQVKLYPELLKKKILMETRKLQVGDFLWIARERSTGFEMTLDYIVERKRIDDLAGSIKDGRFHEQKFRLKQCGLTTLIYLVEYHHSMSSYLGLPLSTVKQAAVNTQIIDEFSVIECANALESCAYLTLMTRQLTEKFRGNILHCCRVGEGRGREGYLPSYAEVSERSLKNKSISVGDIFLKQLVQVSGLTMEKAAAILEHYKTASSLVDAYDECATDRERGLMLAKLKYGRVGRNLGPKLSNIVGMLYSSRVALQ